VSFVITELRIYMRFWGAGVEVPKTLKKPLKSFGLKSRRAGEDWVAEITPVPSSQQKPITDDNTVEIDTWLKMVERYWGRNTRRSRA